MTRRGSPSAKGADGVGDGAVQPLDWIRRGIKLGHGSAMALVILVCSLAVTAAAWWISDAYVKHHALSRFTFQTDDIKVAIAERMRDQEEVLLAGVGLFAASRRVTREEWKNFAGSLEIDEHYPGLQGFGFAARVSPQDKDAHIAEIRSQGFPDYELRPAGEREDYTSIVYLEPFDWRNRRAFGFDMFSEPVRRAAMERARDTGRPAVSGVVKLVQETESEIQSGFLLYLPVYRNGAETDTILQRRAALAGYVYSPFRMADLMAGILRAGTSDINYEVYDAGEVTPKNLLYSSFKTPESRSALEEGDFALTRTLTFAGRAWTLRFTPGENYFSDAEQSQPLFIAAAGLVIDVMLFVVILSLSRQRQKATKLALDMTSELRAQVGQNRAIVDTIADGIAIVDADGQIEEVNPAATKILARRDVDLIGTRFLALLAKRDKEKLHADHARFVSEGDPTALSGRREVRCVSRNGDPFPLEVSISPMQIGGINKFTIALRDLTERERIDRMKSEFVSTVSHELRTPLTSLVGSLGLVKSGAFGSLPDRLDMLVTLADSNARRLSELVNDILDMEKFQSDSMEFDFCRVDIVDLATKTLGELKALGDKKDIVFRLEEHVGQAFVHADRNRLVQVLSNLVANAVKFSPAGDAVVVEIIRRDGTITVFVRDRGPGIPAQFHEKIFDSFFQVDSTDSRGKEGTGLGLTICRTIIAKHGGDIRIDTGYADGCSIRFELAELDRVRTGDQAETGIATAIAV